MHIKNFLVLILFLLSGCANSISETRVIDGVLDLRELQKEDFVIKLHGQWKFYKNTIAQPQAFSEIEPTGFFDIPGNWNKHFKSSFFDDAKGVATFEVNILLPQNLVGKNLAIYSMDQLTNYTIWVDGKEILQSGNLTDVPENSPNNASAEIGFFYLDRDTVDIIFALSNYTYGYGGPHKPIYFGTKKDVLRKFALFNGINFFVLGALIIFSFYQLVFFLQRRKEKIHLYLIIVSLITITRFLIEGMHSVFITTFFPNINYDFVFRFQMAVFTQISYFALLLVVEMLQPGKYKKHLTAALIISSIYSVLFIFGPINMTHTFTLLFILTGALVQLTAFAIIIKSIKDKQEGSIFIFIGTFIFFITALNDALASMKVISSIFMINAGLAITVLFCSVILSKRSNKAFRDVEILSADLEEKNIELQKLDKIKDIFISNTSHEFRTPLQGIIGAAQSLKDITDNSEYRKRVELIILSAKRLTFLINDIQDYSKMMQGDISISQTTVNLSEIVERVISLIKFLPDSGKLDILNTIGNKDFLLYADEDRMEQILYNLIGNAIKFTPNGSVTISASQEDDFIAISIKDTGRGIPKEKIPSVFEPFYQIEEKECLTKGTGLGLTIVKKLVLLHGGDIQVSSDVNMGTEFVFTMPKSKDSKVNNSRSELLTGAIGDFDVIINKTSKQGKIDRKILVVDDEPIILEVMKIFLSEEFETVVAVENGYKALEEIENGTTFDIVILDVLMPGINGYEVLKKIRKKYCMCELPVIMLTALNRISDMKSAFDSGANDYLTKPSSQEEILARVKGHLKSRENWLLNHEFLMLKQDLEEQKILQQEVNYKIKIIESIFDAATYPFVIIDEEDSVEFCNDSFLKILDKNRQQIVGESIYNNANFIDIKRKLKEVKQKIGAIKNISLKLPNNVNQDFKITAISFSENIFVLLYGKKSDTFDCEILPFMQELPEKNHNIAKVVTEIMIKVVEIWETETGLTKIDLAKKSGLWKTHMNPDGWERSKTLDRYLDINKIPENPRLKTVKATLGFVVEKSKNRENKQLLLDLYKNLSHF